MIYATALKKEELAIWKEELAIQKAELDAKKQESALLKEQMASQKQQKTDNEDSAKLLYAMIQGGGDYIRVVVKVLMLSWDTITFLVPRNVQALQFKKLYGAVAWLLATDQRIIVEGKQLEDRKAFPDYNIHDGPILCMNCRLPRVIGKH